MTKILKLKSRECRKENNGKIELPKLMGVSKESGERKTWKLNEFRVLVLVSQVCPTARALESGKYIKYGKGTRRKGRKPR